ncbi:hypothetical protein [Cupriavidus campinensis]|uniref:Uncharacterized protein n=1 Tax=Cupriavidus campinensis TaxID=151783 RepID=A0ABY3ETZ5_9BURK|nr:hypothetical protein [Cupriavidus campinensis]TSP14048.1 hypothetical protein FGG12_06145 [Cupriavidus campinensis]
MITDAQRKAVASMQDLERQVREIYDQQDRLMKILPPLDQLSEMDLQWWINHLPTGFYRTEMRVERSRRDQQLENQA